jgi:hypothetical protein
MNVTFSISRCPRVFAILAFLIAAVVARAQQPSPPPPPPDAPQTSAPADSSAANAAKHKHHLDDFLIHGTVFNDKALSLPGAQLRIRRADEKKFRWTTYTNSRGEFAIRIPPGADYEVVVQSKGFVDATQTVNASNGLSDETMVFRMELPERKK